MNHALVSIAGAIALVASVSPARARPADCALIKAIANPKTGGLQGIAAHSGTGGQVSVVYRGKVTLLAGARDCSIAGPADGFEVECTWDMGTDIERAKKLERRLGDAIDSCLVTDLALQDYKSQTEGLEVLQYYKGSLQARNGGEADIDLEIHHYVDIDGSYSVILSISR